MREQRARVSKNGETGKAIDYSLKLISSFLPFSLSKTSKSLLANEELVTAFATLR